jgi:hypothetical protein
MYVIHVSVLECCQVLLAHWPTGPLAPLDEHRRVLSPGATLRLPPQEAHPTTTPSATSATLWLRSERRRSRGRGEIPRRSDDLIGGRGARARH